MAIGSIGDVEARWNGPEMQAQVERSVGKGLRAGAIFFMSRVKELISVPAPRTRVKDPLTGQMVNVETTRATPGAPPRKFEGRLRGSITYEMVSAQLARVGTNVVYARQLEYGGTIKAKGKMLRWLYPIRVIGGRGKKPKYRAGEAFRTEVTQPAHPFMMRTYQEQQGSLFRIIHGVAGAA